MFHPGRLTLSLIISIVSIICLISSSERISESFQATEEGRD